MFNSLLIGLFIGLMLGLSIYSVYIDYKGSKPNIKHIEKELEELELYTKDLKKKLNEIKEDL